jgi:hypothetical protein
VKEMPLRIETEHNGCREYLAAAPGRLGTVMLDESLFTRDSNGHVHLEPGTVLAKPAESDLWGPYDAEAVDGRQTETNNVLILHDYVTLDNGEVKSDREAAVLLEGLANAGKVTLADGTAISDTVKDALRSQICSVQFKVGS